MHPNEDKICAVAGIHFIWLRFLAFTFRDYTVVIVRHHLRSVIVWTKIISLLVVIAIVSLPPKHHYLLPLSFSGEAYICPFCGQYFCKPRTLL